MYENQLKTVSIKIAINVRRLL